MTLDAATAIREARQRAGLTQTDLAAKAGVTQSVISTYEGGRRNPSFDMMTKLLGAAGASIVIEYVPDELRRLPGTPRGRKINKYREQILSLASHYGATRIRVFGSVARGDDGPSSDIDIAFDVTGSMGLVKLAGFQRELEALLDDKVDAVPTAGLKYAIAAAVDAEGVAL